MIGDLLLAADERAHGLVALVGVDVLLALLQAAHQHGLLLVAGVVVHVALHLGQRADQVALLVVAALVVVVGHRARHGAVQHPPLDGRRAAVLAQRQRNSQHHQQRCTRKQRDCTAASTYAALDLPGVMPGMVLHAQSFSSCGRVPARAIAKAPSSRAGHVTHYVCARPYPPAETDDYSVYFLLDSNR